VPPEPEQPGSSAIADIPHTPTAKSHVIRLNVAQLVVWPKGASRTGRFRLVWCLVRGTSGRSASRLGTACACMGSRHE
jgi:hypothetical protein